MCVPRLLGVELALHVKDAEHWSFIDPLVLRLSLSCDCFSFLYHTVTL